MTGSAWTQATVTGAFMPPLSSVCGVGVGLTHAQSLLNGPATGRSYNRTVSSRGLLLPVAALAAASVLGGGIALAGASALGIGSTTTTVRQIQPAFAGNSPTSF